MHPDPRDTILAKMAEALRGSIEPWDDLYDETLRQYPDLPRSIALLAARKALAEYEAWSGAKGENEGG